MTMRHFVSAACGLWLALAGTASAQSDPLVVVELYTSQGCSSCPPADGYLAELAKDPRVIPLALHVDYWDYIGWKDSFASPQFTQRQKAYARANGSRMIYTPQMIVGGLDRIEGNDPEAVKALIRAHQMVDRPVVLSIRRNGAVVLIRAEADPPLDGMTRVQLVRYRDSDTVAIKRGENAGKTITYQNIVTSWQAIAEWNGRAPLELEASAPGPEPVVVIVQSEGPAEILAAARAD